MLWCPVGDRRQDFIDENRPCFDSRGVRVGRGECWNVMNTGVSSDMAGEGPWKYTDSERQVDNCTLGGKGGGVRGDRVGWCLVSGVQWPVFICVSDQVAPGTS